MMTGELKKRALDSLSGKWGFAVGLTFLYFVLSGVASYIISMVMSVLYIPVIVLSMGEKESISAGGGILFGLLFVVMIVAATSISGVLTLGGYKVCLAVSRGNEGKFDDFFSFFAGWQKMVTAFKAIFFVSLYTILWSLLFVIPGIIKALSYSLTYFVLLDHPEYTVHEAIAESKRLMDGNKWNLFVLGLSFIGWFLLSAITFSISQLWTTPYWAVTFAHFYDKVSDEKQVIAA